MAKKTTRKKRGPQDATRVNVQAANKKFDAILRRIERLEERVADLDGRL